MISHLFRHSWTGHGLSDMGGFHHTAGTWKHAGFHLSSSIAAPPLLTLPFAFVALGWEYGVLMLVLGAAVTFYAYNLLSKVLEHLAEQGRRHLRFRDLATDVLGSFQPAISRISFSNSRIAPQKAR